MRCSLLPYPAPFCRALHRAVACAVTRAVAVTGALAVLALAAPVSYAQPRAAARDDRPTVAVMSFNNGSLIRHAEFEPLSKGIADMLMADLAHNNRVRVVDRDQLQKVLGELALNATASVDRETAVRVGKLLGVHHMVFGGFVIDQRGRMRLVARAVKVETDELEYVESVQRNANDVLELIDDLGRKLNAGMHLPPIPPSETPNAGVRDVAAADTPPRQRSDVEPGGLGNRFRALMLYSRALAEEDGGRRPQAVALYRSALAQYPGYEPARIRLRQLGESS